MISVFLQVIAFSIIMFLYLKTLRRSYQLFSDMATIRFQTKDKDVEYFAKEVLKYVEKDEKTINLRLKCPEWMERIKD